MVQTQISNLNIGGKVRTLLKLEVRSNLNISMSVYIVGKGRAVFLTLILLGTGSNASITQSFENNTVQLILIFSVFCSCMSSLLSSICRSHMLLGSRRLHTCPHLS